MKVILTEKVKSLGGVGEVVNVSPGYARNYIFPRGLGLIADGANQKQMDGYKRALSKKVEEEKTQAEQLAKSLHGVTLKLIKKAGLTGKLFGSVTTFELSQALLRSENLEVEKKTIVLKTPIKALGNYVAEAKLFSGVQASFNIEVILDPKSEEEHKRKQEEDKKRKIEAKKLEEQRIADEKDGKKPEEMTEEEKRQKEVNALLR